MYKVIFNGQVIAEKESAVDAMIIWVKAAELAKITDLKAQIKNDNKTLYDSDYIEECDGKCESCPDRNECEGC